MTPNTWSCSTVCWAPDNAPVVLVAVSATTYLILYPMVAATPTAALAPRTEVAHSEAPGPDASVRIPMVNVLPLPPLAVLPVAAAVVVVAVLLLLLHPAKMSRTTQVSPAARSLACVGAWSSSWSCVDWQRRFTKCGP